MDVENPLQKPYKSITIRLTAAVRKIILTAPGVNITELDFIKK
jgi:hypothetical protein